VALLEPEFVFAYEEALGYCFAPMGGNDAACDKDGILAAAVAARLLMTSGGGKGLAERILGIYREIGMWGSFGHSLRVGGAAPQSSLERKMRTLRAMPWARFGSMRVTAVQDYLQGQAERPWYLGRQDLLQFELEADLCRSSTDPTRGRVLIRPSGTEPKLKVYVHLCSDLSAGASYAALARRQAEVANEIADLVLQVGD
jgi:phosphomannomutase